MALSEMIQLSQELRERIVQRIPESGEANSKLGAQLIVGQGQAAVFYRDGKSLDVFGPGRHTLTTANVPLLTNFLGNLAPGLPASFTVSAQATFRQEGW